MKFTATLVTQPDFELPNYKGLVVPMHATEVTDAEIDESIENCASRRRTSWMRRRRPPGWTISWSSITRGRSTASRCTSVFPKAGKPLSGNDDFWIKMTEEAFFPGYCRGARRREAGRDAHVRDRGAGGFPGRGNARAEDPLRGDAEGDQRRRCCRRWTTPSPTRSSKGKTLAELREMAREELERQKKAERRGRRSATRSCASCSRQVECELPQDMVRTADAARSSRDIVRENQARGVADEVLKENEQQTRRHRGAECARADQGHLHPAAHRRSRRASR